MVTTERLIRKKDVKIPSKTPSRAHLRAWDTRGRIFDDVASMWEEGRTVSEIVETTGYEPVRIRRAREHARERGFLDHPTVEETREARSKAHIGQVSPMKGQNHSFETLLRMSEQRRGRQLTFVETKQISLLAAARRIPDRFKKPALVGLYAEHERRAPAGAWKSRAFLETYYGAKLCEMYKNGSRANKEGENPFVEVKEVEYIYNRINPRVFNRLHPEIVFIDDCIRSFRQEHLVLTKASREREDLSNLIQIIESLSPIVRKYISIANQLMVQVMDGSELKTLKTKLTKVIKGMTLAEKEELLRFGNFVEERLKANQPIGEVLNYGTKRT